jgi:glycosyltransferase involved in cell wall biosynthesis
MLQSVEEIADQIVVVYSVKHGVEQTKKQEFHFRPWDDDFAAARNFAFSKCTGDYILWLDSDDVVPPESAAMIRAALDNPGPKTLDKSVFFCFQLMEPGQEGLGISQPRMTPNLPGIKWTGRIHETHIQSMLDMGLNSVVVDNIHVVHSGYQDREALKEKVRSRNIPMLAKEEDSPHKFYHLGQSNLILVSDRPLLL